MSTPRTPPDVICASCSKPLRPNTLAWLERDEWIHLNYRSRVRTLKAIEETDRTRALRQRAAEKIRYATELREAHSRTLDASIPALPQEPTARTPQARRSLGSLFLLPGEVTSWHPTTRVLTIDEHVVVLSMGASTEPVAVGQRVLAKGYLHRSTGQRIVTQLRRARSREIPSWLLGPTGVRR